MIRRLLTYLLPFLALGCFGETVQEASESGRMVNKANELLVVTAPPPQTLPPKHVDRLRYGVHHPRDLEMHPVHRNPAGQVDLFPEEEEVVDSSLAPARYRVRMNIDQLDAAIRRVTGGIGWTEGNGNNPTNLFEELSLTLGKPDFVQIVNEDLSPSGLFLKFLDDAARSVCQKLVDEEAMNRTQEERVLFGTVPPESAYEDEAAAIDAQLMQLSLRYHGVSLPSDSGALENLRWLFQMAQWRSGQPQAGWEAVCISLITDPAFYSY